MCHVVFCNLAKIEVLLNRVMVGERPLTCTRKRTLLLRLSQLNNLAASEAKEVVGCSFLLKAGQLSSILR